MSEMRDRRHARELLNVYPAYPDSMSCLEAMLESAVPIAEQTRILVMLDDLNCLRPAVSLVGRLKMHDCAPRLIDLYDTFEDAQLRKSLLWALGSLTSECAQPFLLRVVHEGKSLYLRICAAHALQVGKRPEIIDPFLALARDTQESAELRAYLLTCLMPHGDKQLVPRLLPFLRDVEPRVRWDALYAIKRLGDSSFSAMLEPFLRDTATVGRQGDETTIGDYVAQILKAWAAGETDHE